MASAPRPALAPIAGGRDPVKHTERTGFYRTFVTLSLTEPPPQTIRHPHLGELTLVDKGPIIPSALYVLSGATAEVRSGEDTRVQGVPFVCDCAPSS